MKAIFNRLLVVLSSVLAAGGFLTACSRPSAEEASHDHDHDHDHGHAHASGGDHAPERGNPKDLNSGTAGKEASTTRTVAYCSEHQLPENECGICHPELVSTLQPGRGVKVRMPSKDSAKIVGVQFATPQKGAIDDGVECLAELGFNENRQAQISAPVSGIVQSVLVDLGQRVQEKQPVAKVWSSTIAEAVARAVLTHQTLDRERRLRAQRVSSEQDLQKAEADHRAACQQARTLGFSEEQIDAFGAAPNDPVMLEIRAPFAGEIIARTAVQGALVESGKSLFTLADRSTLWATLQVPESALDRIRVGQEAEIRVDAFPQRTFHGQVTWIGAEVDERTRMVRARVEVPNPDGTLRARMFARARILTRVAPDALLLPPGAVHQVQGIPLVFVQLEDDLVEARAVRVGARKNGQMEIQAGLDARDVVAVGRGFAFKSQLLSSRLGAGCAHE